MRRDDIVWQTPAIGQHDRERQAGHRAAVVWLTGLSGAGKSTLAHALEAELHRQGRRTYVLDGDNLRHGLCADLGFTPAERRENLRRAAEVARLMLDAGVITVAAFISPSREDRAMVRGIVGPQHFVEVFVECPLDVCERRDVKGLYRRARQGALAQFTGISAPYEKPLAPDCVVKTHESTLEEGVREVLERLQGRLELDRSGSATSWRRNTP
ncbi:adenylyl-sulfate kinase [Aquabacterium sp. A7-Y]|uniref:adenylyl-sulfate kinase n=1 Tax=Aquabacterium sp. A7-Y TaxID=1349605 RepID=UPI00223DBE5E|nr:adenylyl-sulfate kinase [Aquabacterium sp. A7-Y]MCW7541887.1 adenylyl-sulfate kinase [Aquabacterium sp. A7-Y]